MRLRHFQYFFALALSAALFLASCAAPLNYTLPGGPRYTGCGSDDTVSWNPRTGQPVTGGGAPGTSNGAGAQQVAPVELRVVSFNIKFSVHIDRAVALLRSDPNLRDADLLLLQEMDEPGVRRIAGKLGFCWVYYPATVHPETAHQFGEAILSRYPFLEDHKVLLPHLGRVGRMERIATAATLDIRGTRVRVYSVHLATILELGPGRRADQARAIVDDAARFAGPVIIGGDMNSHGVGQVFADAGYDWLTRHIGPTAGFESYDHFFVRGFEATPHSAIGKSLTARGASDHVPIWTVLRIPPRQPAAPNRTNPAQ